MELNGGKENIYNVDKINLLLFLIASVTLISCFNARDIFMYDDVIHFSLIIASPNIVRREAVTRVRQEFEANFVHYKMAIRLQWLFHHFT